MAGIKGKSGRKKGTVYENAGRKATGLIRNKQFNLRVTEKELNKINELISNCEGKNKLEKFFNLIGLKTID
ncbi:hypothetical protein [Streptobacillus moniliformis]|uniref:hypothetical protein n=1 Tax=Streptobacillus moniliformis TaxID=34105 RepID=UPI0007E3AC8F|nr:hypothetical protein [Streptobacillus moniliformis]